MMDTKSPADCYHAAVNALSKAEAAHRKNLDLLYQAREDRKAHQVTPLRCECQKSERALQDALEAAFSAHRAYWIGRREILEEGMRSAAIVVAEYDAISRLAGDTAQRPALRYLENLSVSGLTGANLLEQDVLASDGVPQEQPDSALLEDELGAWRPF